MSDKPRKSMIRKMFDFLWGLIVTAYRLVVIVLVLLVGVAIWMGLRGGPPVTVEDNVALVLAPTGNLVDQLDEDPSRRFVEQFGGEIPSQSSLRDLIEAIDAAAADDRIAFAVLKLDQLWSGGLAQYDELRAALTRFQDSGKKLIAWGPWYGQGAYYAAAQADEIVLDPYGSIATEGFSTYNNYFSEALEKIGVEIHVFRVGEYKSAVEPFTRNDMSAEARQANLEWLGDLWRHYGVAVANGRGLPEDAAQQYVDGLREGMLANAGDAAAYALAQGWVTTLETVAEFRERMGEQVGIDEDHGSFRQIYYQDYLSAVRHETRRNAKPQAQRKVALVVVQGEIVDGGGEVGQAGGETIAGLLDDARRDPDVDAVVLRVNSPGGSVWASEQIRRAVHHLQADGKPVVASMSSVAASGGYWVSMDADQIWAHETTITGSIGVFGMIPTLDRSLAKLGIHTDGVGTTELAGAFRLDRPLSDDAKVIIQSSIEKIYRDFTGGVAQARGLELSAVQELARGRVWSGEDAMALGLIDKMGSLEQAADAAAELAGLSPGAYVLDERRPQRGFANALLLRFSGMIRANLLPTSVTAWLDRADVQTDVQRLLSTFNDPRGFYAYCLCTPADAMTR